ncbi:ATP-binding protein [Kitasatospora sp. NPDC088346]|uniref:ATP-binding protein n=1 Tax=Kitasatospora sp. NPDC088346 TaxID=3364073 RepID=UPI00382954E8
MNASIEFSEIGGVTVNSESFPSGATPGPANPAPRTCSGEAPGSWELPHRPESAGVARRVTCAALDAWGVDDNASDQVLMVVSELVTNAVEHALPPVTLRVERPAADTVHIEVDDGGPAAQEGSWATTGGPEEHGRGGVIVSALSTAHGSRPLAHGATHWADVTAV